MQVHPNKSLNLLGQHIGVLENPLLKVAPSEDIYLANLGMNFREPEKKEINKKI